MDPVKEKSPSPGIENNVNSLANYLSGLNTGAEDASGTNGMEFASVNGKVSFAVNLKFFQTLNFFLFEKRMLL